MNCIIPGPNLKVFAKALHALAKVGDNLYLEACGSKLTFVSLNLRKTICVTCTFFDSFFSSYELGELQDVACKIQMKTLIPLFKGTHLEKKFDFIKIQYELEDDALKFKMKYKCDDIVMIHRLRLMEQESLKIQIAPDDGCNNILGSSSFYNQFLNTFSITDDEITLEISKEKVIARNYCLGAPVKPKSVRSHVNLCSSEFNTFHVEKEAAINFSLKPLRTAIHFADVFNLPIALNFEKGGCPLAIVMKNPTFEVNLIVATLDPYSDGQMSMSTCSIPARITQTNRENINLTIEDQKALLNEDWDDFNMETDQLIATNGKARKKTGFEEILAKTKERRKSNSYRVKENVTFNTKENEEFAFSRGVSKDNNKHDFVPGSPESPTTKRAKLVFGRCFESTFSKNNLGEILAPNSDSE